MRVGGEEISIDYLLRRHDVFGSADSQFGFGHILLYSCDGYV